MTTIFSSLELGLRSLRAQSKSLDVTAHNIANANTPGYSRQRAELGTTSPYAIPSMNTRPQAGQIGSGVEVKQIKQLRDHFLDQQLRHETTLLGGWDENKEIIQKLEVFLNEPSEEGISNAINAFFSVLEDLTLNPESVAIRESLRQHGDILASTVNRVDYQLETFQKDLNETISFRVEEVNDMAERIAHINSQIVRVKGSGDNPNDLMDERRLLAEELSKMVPISIHEDSRGNYNITIRGVHLVQGHEAKSIDVVENPNNNNFYDLRWNHTGKDVILTGGSIAGMIQGRDQILGDFRLDLDRLSNTLIEEFNAVHRMGYGLNNSTEMDFFKGDSAGTFGVAEEILEDLNNIAAASIPDAPGDAENAQRLVDLRSEKFLEGGTASFEDFYRSITSRLGVMGQKAQRMSNNQTLVVDSIREQQDRVSGVSLDEEMANMIKFQHAYSAASRVIRTVDEMVETLLGMVM